MPSYIIEGVDISQEGGGEEGKGGYKGRGESMKDNLATVSEPFTAKNFNYVLKSGEYFKNKYNVIIVPAEFGNWDIIFKIYPNHLSLLRCHTI